MKRTIIIVLSILLLLLVSLAAKWLVFDTVLKSDPDSGRQRVAASPEDAR